MLLTPIKLLIENPKIKEAIFSKSLKSPQYLMVFNAIFLLEILGYHRELIIFFIFFRNLNLLDQEYAK